MKLTRLLPLMLLACILLVSCSSAQTATHAPETVTKTPLPQPEMPLFEFFESSWREITLRYPETVLEVGLTDIYGITEVKLDDISLEYQHETYRLLQATLDKLHAYDRDSLSSQEQISYDIYEWYLEDQLAGEHFLLHDYPATYFITAIPEQMIQFFRDIHPVEDLQDSRDYVTRLGLVGVKMDQLIDILEQQEEVGIRAPEFAVQWTTYGTVGSIANGSAMGTPFYSAFMEKVMALPDVDNAEKQAILTEAEDAITAVVIPAFRRLYLYLTDMPVYQGEKGGVWRLPEGEAYYAYRLAHFTTTDLTSDEIHRLGQDELERLHSAMRVLFDQLGYPEDENLVELFNRVAADGGHVSGNDVLTTYEELIDEAKFNLDTVFDMLPRADVIVVADQYGGYYIRPSLDGSRPGAFYAGVGGSGEDYYAMPTLAYHEAIPGHHLQIALAMEMEGLSAFQGASLFTAYIEGWALYAEQLAYELDWYADDPYGVLGYLQAQAFRAARLVVDTGLHTQGWTFDEAQQFFTENTGFEVGDSVNPQHQIARYLVWPGQSTSYYIGYLKIMELRQRTMDELGNQFDLKEFHRVILGNGGMPLEILERVIDDYIAEKKSDGS